MLAQHYRHPPENVVIFSADDEDTLSVLPIFFQALDIVCFPAMPGTSLSMVLEAMAYGAPCVAMTKYGMPEELWGTGVAIKADWDNFGNFHVPMDELSSTISKWLQPFEVSGLCENFTERIVHQYTRKNAAQALVGVFAECSQREPDDLRTENPLFPPIFCHRYDPDTGEMGSSVYRLGMNRYDRLETAVAEALTERHTPAESNRFSNIFGERFWSL